MPSMAIGHFLIDGWGKLATEATARVVAGANLLMVKIILAVQVFVPAAYLVGDHGVEMWIGQEAHKKMRAIAQK